MKKILLLGDSIRQGYDKYVKMAFEGVAEVYYPSENCRFTSYMLRYLSAWKDELQCGNDIDLVHWNAGLWDDLVLPDGLHHIPLDTYQENVERICKMLQSLFPKAKSFLQRQPPCKKSFSENSKSNAITRIRKNTTRQPRGSSSNAAERSTICMRSAKTRPRPIIPTKRITTPCKAQSCLRIK